MAKNNKKKKIKEKEKIKTPVVTAAINKAPTFDFLRQTMSLLSPTTLIIIVLSFFTFLSEDKWGNSSFQYKALTCLSALVLMVVIIAIVVDFFTKSKGRGVLAWIANLIILAFFIVFIGMILYYGVISAANLYTAMHKYEEVIKASCAGPLNI